MVLNLIDPHGPKNSESSLVAEGKRLDPTAYDRAAIDRVGARPTPIIRAAYEQHQKISHWVVVVSRSTRGIGKASDYTTLDPGGHTVVNSGSTNYILPYDAQGSTSANYFVTVSGRLTTLGE